MPPQPSAGCGKPWPRPGPPWTTTTSRSGPSWSPPTAPSWPGHTTAASSAPTPPPTPSWRPCAPPPPPSAPGASTAAPWSSPSNPAPCAPAPSSSPASPASSTAPTTPRPAPSPPCSTSSATPASPTASRSTAASSPTTAPPSSAPSSPPAAILPNGKVPEWTNGAVSKTVDVARRPWVRIPSLPHLLVRVRAGRRRRHGLTLLSGGDRQDDPDHDETKPAQDRPQPRGLPTVPQLLGPGDGRQDESGEHASQAQEGHERAHPPASLCAHDAHRRPRTEPNADYRSSRRPAGLRCCVRRGSAALGVYP